MTKSFKTPESASEITAEWLKSVLHPDVFDCEIVSIEIDKNFEPWSLLGKAVRVKLNYAAKRRNRF